MDQTRQVDRTFSNVTSFILREEKKAYLEVASLCAVVGKPAIEGRQVRREVRQ